MNSQHNLKNQTLQLFYHKKKKKRSIFYSKIIVMFDLKNININIYEQ